MNIFGANNFGSLEKALDGLNKRHGAIANNIANVDTPGYKRKDVSFRDQLEAALEGKYKLATTNKRHISITARDLSGVSPEIYTEENSKIRNDKNNVSIDAEMANLAKNTLDYQTVMKQLSNQFTRLETAITKGGRF